MRLDACSQEARHASCVSLGFFDGQDNLGMAMVKVVRYRGQ